MTKENEMGAAYGCNWGGHGNRCQGTRASDSSFCAEHRDANAAAYPKAGETWILADCGCVGTLAGSQNPKGMWRLTYMVPCAYGQDAFHYALDPGLKGAARVTVTTVAAGPPITLTGMSHQAGAMAVAEASGKAMAASVEAQDRYAARAAETRVRAYQRAMKESYAIGASAKWWITADPAKEPSKAVVTVYRNPPIPPAPRYEVSEDGKHWVPYAALTDAGPLEAFAYHRQIGQLIATPSEAQRRRVIAGDGLRAYSAEDNRTAYRMALNGHSYVRPEFDHKPTPEPWRCNVTDEDLLEDV